MARARALARSARLPPLPPTTARFGWAARARALARSAPDGIAWKTKGADAHHASPRFIAGANSISSIRMGAASGESVSPQHLGAQIPIAEHAAPPTARASRGFVLWRFSYAGRQRLQHDWRAAGIRKPLGHSHWIDASLRWPMIRRLLERSLYQPLTRTDAGLADHGPPLPPRRRPWKRAVLPRPLLPHYHRRAHFVPMKRHSGCLRPCDLLFVMYLTSPAQEGALKWQARKSPLPVDRQWEDPSWRPVPSR